MPVRTSRIAIGNDKVSEDVGDDWDPLWLIASTWIPEVFFVEADELGKNRVSRRFFLTSKMTKVSRFSFQTFALSDIPLWRKLCLWSLIGDVK